MTDETERFFFLRVSAALREYIPAVWPLLVFLWALVSSCDIPEVP
jgi:hypothetical protein